jgi:hypothetical protein
MPAIATKRDAMALNLEAALRAGDFELSTDAIGTLFVRSADSVVLRIAGARAHNNEPAEAIVQELIRATAFKEPRPDDEKWNEDPTQTRPTEEELSLLTPREIEEFARRLVEKNRHYAFKSVPEQGSGESCVAYLVRGLAGLDERERVEREKAFAGFGESVRESIARNTTANAKLARASLVDLHQPLERSPLTYVTPLNVPRNPGERTNEILEQLVSLMAGVRKQTEASANVIGSLNDVIVSMQAEYVQNAKKAGRHANAALGFAALGIIVSTVFSALTYRDAHKAGAESEAAVKAVRADLAALVTAQREAAATGAAIGQAQVQAIDRAASAAEAAASAAESARRPAPTLGQRR